MKTCASAVRVVAAVALVSIFWSVSSRAASVTVDAFDRGYYINTGEHVEDRYNTFTGIAGYDQGPTEQTDFRSFFAFYIPNHSVPFASAVLRLQVELYAGNAPEEHLRVVDVVSSVPALLTGHTLLSAEGLSIFDDLGSGETYADFSVLRRVVGGSGVPGDREVLPYAGFPIEISLAPSH